MRRKLYTALVPKTIKATRKTGKNFLRKLDYYIKNGTRRLRKIPKSIDMKLAKSIRSISKKRRFK